MPARSPERDPPGLTFDRIAEEYDRVRRGYPPELVDAACEIAGLEARDRVLEVGCGTGKLTRALVARGLHVEAVDPGARLVRVARRHLGDSDASFHIGRFEDADLPADAFAAVFSAAAFHWIDPAVGWAKAARVLRPGGTLALLSHTLEPEPEMAAAWRRVLPEEPAWVSRDARTLFDGAEARTGNVSEVWAWFGRRDIARPEAATLFRDVHVRSVPVERTETVTDVLAMTRTASAYLRLDAGRRARLEELIAGAVEDMGGTYRPTVFAVLATARRA